MKKIRWDLIGIFGGATGVILAVIAILRTRDPNRLLIAVAMIVIFGGMGITLYKMLWAPKFNAQKLQKTGIDGKAKILEVHETNIAVNNRAQLKLQVQIRGNNGLDYTTSCKVVVSKLRPVAFFQPGREINIKIDPQNEKNVIVA